MIAFSSRLLICSRIPRPKNQSEENSLIPDENNYYSKNGNELFPIQVSLH